MVSEYEQEMLEQVGKAKKVKTDAGEVERHSLDELARADAHVSSKGRIKRGTLGIIQKKLKPPGAV